MSAFNFDRSFFQIWINDKSLSGRPAIICEGQDIDEMPLTRDKLIDGLIDWMSPRFGPGHIVAVIESNPYEGWSEDITREVTDAMEAVALDEDGYVKRTDPNKEHRLTSQDVLGGWM